jgi:extracellular matrix regulatory protein A
MDKAEFIRIGYGNLVSASRIIAVVSPDSAPVKRLIQESRDRGSLIDATTGRKTRAVIVMDSDHLVLSALPVDELATELDTAPTAESNKDSRGGVQ